MSKPFTFSIDRAGGNVIWVQHNLHTVSDVRIIISDYDIDCPYYQWDLYAPPAFNGWIVPMSLPIMDVINRNPNFAGFCVRVYSKEYKILQTEYLRAHDGTTPLVSKYFTDQFDCVGASYIDFFYGGLCDGMDMRGVVIDAGANAGFFTLYAKMHGAKRIYTIEPDPSPFFYLHKNYRDDANIILMRKAMDTHVGTINFSVSNTTSVGNGEMLTKSGADWFEIEVDTINIDAILAVEDRINLLKLDIEGTEYRVIEAMTSEQFSRIDRLFVEFHNYSTPLFDKLVANGYTVEYRNSTPTDKVGFLYATRPI
jgi:FkbM family methyltransferase